MGILSKHKQRGNTGDSKESPSTSRALTSKLLSKVRSAVVGKYGKGVLVSETVAETVTGNVKAWLKVNMGRLDRVLGKANHGIPLGKLIEVSGLESHGKSALCLKLLALTQQAGGVGILFDTEESYDPHWAKTIGINTKELIVVEPDDNFCLEVCFEMIRDMVLKIRATEKKSKAKVRCPILVVVDTIYCCPTEEQLDDGSFLNTSNKYGPLASALNKHLPKLCNFIKRKDVGLIFVNQMRDNIGVKYGDKYRTPGGHTLLHMAQIRVRVKRVHKKGKLGIESVVENIKNKVAPPFEQTTIEIGPGGVHAPSKKKKEASDDKT